MSLGYLSGFRTFTSFSIESHLPNSGLNSKKMELSQLPQLERDILVKRYAKEGDLCPTVLAPAWHAWPDAMISTFHHLDPNIFVEEFSPSHPSRIPQQFSNFSKLPAELRLQIWQMALPGSTRVRREWNNSKFRFELRRTPPAVLQACIESRMAFKSTKVPSQGSGSGYELVHITTEPDDPGIFVDWEKDALLIHRGCT